MFKKDCLERCVVGGCLLCKFSYACKCFATVSVSFNDDLRSPLIISIMLSMPAIVSCQPQLCPFDSTCKRLHHAVLLRS